MRHYARNRSRAERKQEPGDPCWYSYPVYPNEAYLPTIVTTNYDTEALIDRMTPRESHDSMTARATIDRLMEMCRGITLTGQSWRSR